MPGQPPPTVGAPPFVGDSVSSNGGSRHIAVLVGCAPAGAVVTARIEPVPLDGVFDDSYWLLVQDANGGESFPNQEHIVESSDPVITIASDPLDEAACIRVIVQAPGYFDLPGRPFHYVVNW